jgi:hypothetical protein
MMSFKNSILCDEASEDTSADNTVQLYASRLKNCSRKKRLFRWYAIYKLKAKHCHHVCICHIFQAFQSAGHIWRLVLRSSVCHGLEFRSDGWMDG